MEKTVDLRVKIEIDEGIDIDFEEENKHASWCASNNGSIICNCNGDAEWIGENK